MEIEKFDAYIEGVISCIRKLQNKDGSFGENIFTTAFVLHSLKKISGCNNLEKDTIEKMAKKSELFLSSQKNLEGSWNYHYRQRPAALPDDIDDTFCVLSSIHISDPEKINPADFAVIEKILKSTREKTSGVYNTWIYKTGYKKDSTWNDTDPVVNANIAYFLALCHRKSGCIAEYIDKAIEQDFPSKYYSNPLLSSYFVCRGYGGMKKETLKEKVYLRAERESKKETNPTGLAFCLASLLYLGESPHNLDIQKYAEKIIGVRKNTSGLSDIGSENLYIEKISKNGPEYARSTAMEYAIRGEAISLYLRAQEKDMSAEIVAYIENRICVFPKQLQHEMTSLLRKTVITGKKSKAFLFPFHVSKNLLNCSVDKEHTLVCCALGVYGWMAYTIYDSIMDQPGDTRQLPIATILYREFCTLGNEISKKNTSNKSFGHFFKEFMDTMESTQYTEITKLRLKIDPSREIVFLNKSLPCISSKEHIEKSIGYALPSLGILLGACSDYSVSETQGIDELNIKRFIKFFRGYIEIMQAGDDLRDWHEDINNGILTPITRQIIQHWRTSGNQKETHINLIREKNCLQKIYDRHVLKKESRRMIKKVNALVNIIDSMTFFTNTTFIKENIIPYKKTAKNILSRPRETIKQCKDPAYTPPHPQTPPRPG
jgi:hypothetical protein